MLDTDMMCVEVMLTKDWIDMKTDLLKNEIDDAESCANQIIESIIDQIVFGPQMNEQQIKIIWANIEHRAHKFVNERLDVI